MKVWGEFSPAKRARIAVAIVVAVTYDVLEVNSQGLWFVFHKPFGA